jgi:hypothetical protein
VAGLTNIKGAVQSKQTDMVRRARAGRLQQCPARRSTG